MATGQKNFKLIVQYTVSCLEILKYLDKHINKINNLGAIVHIKKVDANIDDALADMFRRKGITRLPALIAPDGTLFIGIKQVFELFEKNLKFASGSRTARPMGNSGNTNYDDKDDDDDNGGGGGAGGEYLNNFYEKELFSNEGNGRYVPRMDDEEDENEQNDIQRKMSDYNRSIKPTSKNEGKERNIGQNNRNKKQRAQPVDDISEEDNITYEGYNEPVPPKRKSLGGVKFTPTGDKDDDMDQRMISAYLEKVPDGESMTY